MPDEHKRGDLFIVDNSDKEWKVQRYLREWCEISESFDIATGFFEIGSLLALDEHWQKLDHIRILMGDEVSKRTQKAFQEAVGAVVGKLDDSLESEKEINDFLTGTDAIVEALRSGKITCKVFKNEKFHAKAYITHGRLDVVGSAALVGSSNFTYPGLSQNIELNIQIRREVELLQEWYEKHWQEAEDVTPEILRTIERHTREYSPFIVYAKSLYEYFKGYEQTPEAWEHNESKIYPILSQYQREGYSALLKRASRYKGAFLCDGVGLGKTFIGLMLIERLIMHDRLNVALFVPKAARKDVWERNLKRYLPHLFGKFSHLAIFNHTDLLRTGEFPEDLESVRQRADVIIIDEAHHFRNTGTKGDPDNPESRYWKLFEIAEGKTLYLITATPVNNRLRDLQHMIELFSRQQTNYFKDAPLGIHSLRGHFQKMEKALDKMTSESRNGDEEVDTNLAEAEEILRADDLFRALVVQRSRTYVKKSCEQESSDEIPFPKPNDPEIAEYSVKETYGELLGMIEDAFNKQNPLFSLPIYYPYGYYIGDEDKLDPLALGRQRQVVSLIRTGFLKRFESSAEAFRMSCWNLLRKLIAWIEVHAETDHEKRVIDRWRRQHNKLIKYLHEQQMELFGETPDEEAEEDIITEEMLEAVEELSRDEFKVNEIIDETILDMDQIVTFLHELEKFEPSQDNKLQALITLLKNDPVLKEHKVLIFSEFMDTARYLKKQLVEAGIDGIEQVDSATKGDRSEIIRRFSPYYNDSSSRELVDEKMEEIRVLISTDVLSEGLNLQDATRLVNYDLHWNPVRLMQRIGRIDRRLDSEIEAKIINDHPDLEKLRGEVAYWNFLPPGELDVLLRLYKTVSKKTLRISKTFGIEGKKLLHPDDDYESLRDFTDTYEGTLSPAENMHLELQALFKEMPELQEQLDLLPGRVFSGKKHPEPDTKAVFFCYALPAKQLGESSDEDEEWSIEAGSVQWYLYSLDSEQIIEAAPEIVAYIRSEPDTHRSCDIEKLTLSEIRNKIDKHIKNTYMKKVQAPFGINPQLKAWMEIN